MYVYSYICICIYVYVYVYTNIHAYMMHRYAHHTRRIRHMRACAHYMPVRVYVQTLSVCAHFKCVCTLYVYVHTTGPYVCMFTL